jgi:hypothetical protein
MRKTLLFRQKLDVIKSVHREVEICKILLVPFSAQISTVGSGTETKQSLDGLVKERIFLIGKWILQTGGCRGGCNS